MCWTVRRSDLFEVIRAQYQSELDEQLQKADSDTLIYRIQRSFDKWTRLRQDIEDFESNPCDPGLVLPPARHRFRRIPDVYRLRRGSYNALYRRYVNPPQAIAFLLYHDRDREKRFRQLLDYPPYQ
jgi:hypothetical protein